MSRRSPPSRRLPRRLLFSLALIAYFTLGALIGFGARVLQRSHEAARAPVEHIEALTEGLVLLRQGKDDEAARRMRARLHEILELRNRYPDDKGLALSRPRAWEVLNPPDVRAGSSPSSTEGSRR